MSFELKLALRYFRAKRKSLARFTSVVAVVGIAAGVASLILAEALARGFASEMQDKILANTAHVSIFLPDGAEISGWEEIREKVRNTPNVSRIRATAFENALAISDDGTSHAVLRAYAGETPAPPPADGSEIPGPEPGTILVGAKLAEKLRLEPGQTAAIVTLENQPPSRFQVAGVFETGLYDYDSVWIYLAPGDFARLRGESEFAPTVLSVSVSDIYQADETARAIRAGLDAGFQVVDWQEANRPLFAALSLERRVALAIISLIIFIAALNITTTLALLVGERRLDIAILRTCGAQTRSIVLLFLLEGLFLGFLGIAGGVALGLAGCYLGNYFGIISLSAEVYAISHIPFRPAPSRVVLIALAASLLCLISTFYPALRASRVKPLENLRTQ